MNRSKIEGLYNFILMIICVGAIYSLTSWFIDEMYQDNLFVNIGRVLAGILVAMVLIGFIERSFRKDIMKTIKRGIMK